eukprot:9327714-Ditylum_brightwellii.AAC.1
MCDKKAQDEDKNKKAGQMHLTIDENQDFLYEDWGSMSVGGLMFHQHGVTHPNQSYRSALLRTNGPTEKCHHHKDRPAGKWSAAANHLLQ